MGIQSVVVCFVGRPKSKEVDLEKQKNFWRQAWGMNI
jgi:hypothetical protein